jgi:glycopeptide antibiotics resistance protein
MRAFYIKYIYLWVAIFWTVFIVIFSNVMYGEMVSYMDICLLLMAFQISYKIDKLCLD